LLHIKFVADPYQFGALYNFGYNPNVGNPLSRRNDHAGGVYVGDVARRGPWHPGGRGAFARGSKNRAEDPGGKGGMVHV